MIKQILGKLPKKPLKSANATDDSDFPIMNSSNFSAAAGVGDVNGFSKSTPSTEKLSDVGLNGTFTYEALPSFRDVPNSEKQNLFLAKLKMCCIIFDFSDATKNLKEKDIKRQTLLELVDYISSVNSKFNEIAMQEITKMVASNLFRTFPSSHHDPKLPDIYEVDEEDLTLEPSWSHLQIVYEFLLRFVASSETDAKLAKRYIDHSFLLHLLDLFDSEDQREREYLKTILHRIYGKFMVHRPFIRKAINNVFYRFILETEKQNGIAELLEILGSIVNGFALPLKEEHKFFLSHALIPLHKPKCISMYHQQLSYCITQFVEKDSKLADTVIRGLLKYWPVSNSSKEILFLGELEEVLEATQVLEFQLCMVPLSRQIGRCLSSSHFQVAERALLLWNNDRIRYMITQNRGVILPIIFPALERNARHWNQAVQSLTINVRKIFSEADQFLLNDCLEKYEGNESKESLEQEKREQTWRRLEVEAASKAKAENGEALFVSMFASSVGIS